MMMAATGTNDATFAVHRDLVTNVVALPHSISLAVHL